MRAAWFALGIGLPCRFAPDKKTGCCWPDRKSWVAGLIPGSSLRTYPATTRGEWGA
jgi:hypothetical protein